MGFHHNFEGQLSCMSKNRAEGAHDEEGIYLVIIVEEHLNDIVRARRFASAHIGPFVTRRHCRGRGGLF